VPGPWVSSIEGRDYTSGADVILIGDPREEDMDVRDMDVRDMDVRDRDVRDMDVRDMDVRHMDVSRDSGPASAADLDLIAAARNRLAALIAAARRGSSSRRTPGRAVW